MTLWQRAVLHCITLINSFSAYSKLIVFKSNEFERYVEMNMKCTEISFQYEIKKI